MANIKQVIIIRKDLKMRRGKEIAQGSHASMAFLSILFQDFIRGAEIKITDEMKEWLTGFFAKVCLQVDSEAEIVELHQKALMYKLESHLITDSGFTEFHNVPTITALAIGPNRSEEIDKITGHLKLY